MIDPMTDSIPYPITGRFRAGVYIILAKRQLFSRRAESGDLSVTAW